MLEILKNYPWTRLSMWIIGVIKRQFFHMATHVFDNCNLLQEIFATDPPRAVIYSLGHGLKHMLTILHTIWRPGLRLSLSIERFLIFLLFYIVIACFPEIKCKKGLLQNAFGIESNKKDCFRTLFKNFIEELTKHESCILRPNCFSRSLFLLRLILSFYCSFMTCLHR